MQYFLSDFWVNGGINLLIAIAFIIIVAFLTWIGVKSEDKEIQAKQNQGTKNNQEPTQEMAKTTK
ncbi:hypothetical protein [Aneurinibacillus terranovensis]|uniref:hypothetical protein n=1 Tax=Aneurinibacillus terranovensis TaxID=278991 RepID=UPI0003FB6700|nr:hypothetical protein [Aneurinibacillus terranovensis]